MSKRWKRATIYRTAHCWCGHSARAELVVVGRLGSVWRGLVCRYHLDLWNWPEERVECRCDACQPVKGGVAAAIAQRPLTGV